MHPTHPTLGTAGPGVSRLGLGRTSVTGACGPTDRHEAAATLLEALHAGITVFDTADFYADGANEELLGRTLAPHRDRAVPATRAGVRRTAQGLAPPVHPMNRGGPAKPRCAGCAPVEDGSLPAIRGLGATLVASSPGLVHET